MLLPKLTPLQSRFAASLIASALLVILYSSLTSPQFAYAAEIDSRIPPDHNHPIIFDNDFEMKEHDGLLPEQELDNLAERRDIYDRAPAEVAALANNEAQNMNINPGETQKWMFRREALNSIPALSGRGLPKDKNTEPEPLLTGEELRKRQTTKTLYVTLNTCLQPLSKGSADDMNKGPPQLTMWVSTSTSIEKPGPAFGADPSQRESPVSGGYGSVIMSNIDSDVYIGVSAPNTSDFTGVWNYEIAGSIDAPFHGSNDTWSNLNFIDGDSHAALLVTDDTTQALPNETTYKEWMSISPPYSMFAHNMNDSAILGVANSYCGLRNYAQIIANQPNVDNQNVALMTSRGVSGNPKEQFYITSLNASSTYWGFLAMDGNSIDSGNGVVGGGGTVWAAMNFTTKTDNNCALMYNLSFCSEVAYAVPSNPQKYSPETGLQSLAAVYDSYAANLYTYFNYSLQQIPCNTTSTAQYSLARNCTDCANAYKKWLCAVTMPRCEDFSNPSDWLMPRNTAQNFINGSSFADMGQPDANQQQLFQLVATNSSRNPIIDETIGPGPYKEVLPCEDLCYELVRSCPAALGFSCPLQKKGLKYSYGHPGVGQIRCNYPGANFYMSGAQRHTRIDASMATLFALALVGFQSAIV